LVENDSTLAMSPNSQVKQQQQDELPSKSSTPTLSISPSLPTINILAPQRAVSFDDKEHEFLISSPKRPTSIKLAPRFTLRMRSRPVLYPQDETLSNHEIAHQCQLLLWQASVDAFDHHDSVLSTPRPRLHSPSSDFLSPPSVPKHDREDDCIFVRYIPTELVLPGLP
jgi:hypothetical protein